MLFSISDLGGLSVSRVWFMKSLILKRFAYDCYGRVTPVKRKIHWNLIDYRAFDGSHREG